VTDTDLAAAGRAIVDRIAYLTLATVDAQGRSWVSPVFYATADYREFFWVSAPGTTHSRNIAGCPQVSAVIFDSTVAPGTGQAVYLTATAELVADTGIERALRIYPGPRDRGWRPTRADVQEPAPYRLYVATATEQSMLCPRDEAQPCAAHGLAHDHRTQVRL
jgi:pyridoxamine 5'-phosphate oxidase-like protein